jgi:hypothetical protein
VGHSLCSYRRKNELKTLQHRNELLKRKIYQLKHPHRQRKYHIPSHGSKDFIHAKIGRNYLDSREVHSLKKRRTRKQTQSSTSSNKKTKPVYGMPQTFMRPVVLGRNFLNNSKLIASKLPNQGVPLTSQNYYQNIQGRPYNTNVTSFNPNAYHQNFQTPIVNTYTPVSPMVQSMSMLRPNALTMGSTMMVPQVMNTMVQQPVEPVSSFQDSIVEMAKKKNNANLSQERKTIIKT